MAAAAQRRPAQPSAGRTDLDRVENLISGRPPPDFATPTRAAANSHCCRRRRRRPLTGKRQDQWLFLQNALFLQNPIKKPINGLVSIITLMPGSPTLPQNVALHAGPGGKFM